MIGKVLDFIVGREPVASATGIAGLVTAALGLIAALGVDLDPELVAAVATLAAALAGWLARKAVSPVARVAGHEPERGAAVIWFLVALALAITAVFVACDALWDDEDEADDVGAPAWVMDRDERNRNGNDCNDNEGECSDDDQLVIAPVICVEPGSCRFG